MENLTEERKAALVSDLEAYINRYLDKQWIVSEAIDIVAEDSEEKQFLNQAFYEFKVYYRGVTSQ